MEHCSQFHWLRAAGDISSTDINVSGWIKVRKFPSHRRYLWVPIERLVLYRTTGQRVGESQPTHIVQPASGVRLEYFAQQKPFFNFRKSRQKNAFSSRRLSRHRQIFIQLSTCRHQYDNIRFIGPQSDKSIDNFLRFFGHQCNGLVEKNSSWWSESFHHWTCRGAIYLIVRLTFWAHHFLIQVSLIKSSTIRRPTCSMCKTFEKNGFLRRRKNRLSLSIELMIHPSDVPPSQQFEFWLFYGVNSFAMDNEKCIQCFCCSR